MKILMVLDQKIPTDLRVENEATTLIKAGHKVGLLSIYPYQKSEVITYKGIKIYRVAISEFHWKKMHGLAGMIPWMDIFITRKVSKILKEEEYDAIHLHDLYLFGAVKRLQKKFKKFYIGDMHENYVEVINDYNWATKFPNSLLISQNKWLKKEKQWLKDLDKVITVSEGIRQRIISKGVKGEDAILLPNTIHTEVFDSYTIDQSIISKYRNTYNLIYVGGFVPNRGLEHVIAGSVFLQEVIPNLRLILVGDGEMRQSLLNLVKAQDLQEIVIFEGWQNQEKIKSYLQVSDIGLIPFKRTPQTDNSSSNKLFQYMYFKLPVVATNCTSVKDLIDKENCGIVYESDVVEQFVDSVLLLYKNREKALQLGKNGQQAIISKYNWETSSRDLLKMYHNLGS